ncbi:MAG: hypothetical protein E7625_00010 [Ruminococcaceae bacterium]|nr:hypothetical protein [Oscillospiraceae bacterium]
MNKCKFKFLILSLCLVMLASLLLLAGCGGSKVSGIAIKTGEMPRTSYVQGQELDLTGGVITAMVSGTETAIPMTAEGVSITGYDKNTLGKQTVTVTYEGQTTTFEVTVVARMIADGYKNEYFVGDAFDASQGKLKITRDDATAFTVNLNSDLVTIEPFDSSKAGQTSVKAVYNDGKGTVYEAELKVTVYPIGQVTFTKPSKAVYSSHDTELSLAGGYFTVKAEGSDLSNYVPLTLSMVSGFDPSIVTSANRDTPYEQTVTFTYAGQTFEFKISILYSGVSVVRDAAKALADVTLEDENATLSAELGEIALDAAREYFKLTQARKDLIDDESTNLVMRCAAVYVLAQFKEEALTYEDTFRLSEAGNLSLITKDYESTKANLERFDSEEEKFNVYVELLHHIKEDFADLILYGETKLEDYIKVPTADELNFYSGVFAFMLNLHESFSTIPADWTEKTLSQYEYEIATTLKKITASVYVGPNFNAVYNAVSSWRERNDYFEIIYTYYLHVAEDKQSFFETINGDNGLKLSLPGDLQLWYTCISQGATQLQYMGTNADGAAYLYDTTRFMYYYYKTAELAQSIKNSDNPLHVEIYNFIGGDSLAFKYLEHPHALGYMYHSSTMLESAAYKKMWDSYIELASIYLEGKMNVKEQSAKFDAVLKDLAALSPAEVYGFICSMTFRYNESRGNALVFDYTDTTSNTLVFLLANYGAANLSEGARDSFRLLLASIEKYALVGIRANALSEFKDGMAQLIQQYNAMSAEDRTSFDRMMGDCYNKYLTIYNTCNRTETPNDLGVSKDTYLELKDAFDSFFDVLKLFNDTTQDEKTRQTYFPLLFALCEKSHVLYTDLLEEGTPEAVNAMFSVYHPLNDVNMTLDQAYSITRDFFCNNLIFKTIAMGTAENPQEVLFWLLYSDSALRPFMVKISDLMCAHVSDTYISASAVTQILSDFRAMNPLEQNLFYMFGFQLYYDSLHSHLSKDDESIASFITTVLQAEIGYVSYMMDPEDPGRVEFFTNCMTPAIEAYNALSNKDKLPEDIKNMYNFYLEEYNKVK